MDQKKALGRGLTSLIPSGGKSEITGDRKYVELSLDDIVTNHNQPRKLFSKEAIDELAQSIEEKGVIQPVLVRPLGGGKYELIAGERRYRASKQVGLEKIPAIVKEVEAKETLELALIENIQRENLNAIEEALAYKDLLSKFQYTQDELAKRLGKDRSSIANSLRLLKLPDAVRSSLINNELSMGHARALLAIDDKDSQTQIAKDVVANGLSVRETENLIKRLKQNMLDEMRIDDSEETTAPESGKSAMMSLETRMKEALKLFVKVSGNYKRGRIVISYQNEEELNSVCQKLLD